jgi:soluble lytic murein transglycosylase-like protein
MKMKRKLFTLSLIGILYFGNPNEVREGTIQTVPENNLEEIIQTLEEVPLKKIKKNQKINQILEEEYNNLKNFPPYFSLDVLSKLIYAESRYNEKAKSRSDARGLMQLKRSAWYQVEKNLDYDENVFDPRRNIQVGLKYILWLDEYCKKRHPQWEKISDKEKRRIILAAYNAGVTRLASYDWNLDKLPQETRYYVKYFED